MHTCAAAALSALAFANAPASAQTPVPEGYSSLDVRPPQAAADLNRHLARLANNPRDMDALIGAGTAALDLEDPRAATGFFARAEGIDPNDGRVKAGLGRAMVQMENPRDALRLFAEAVNRGAAERLFLSDRGLAYDLTGDPVRAQSDYQAAMRFTPNNDELIRRYAVSLGISGKWAEAEKLLEPLLYRNDRSAWRNRAFILAMNGQQERARTITQSVMPKPLADAIQPYMDRMANLTAAQRAAAVHFGHFPADMVKMAAAPSSQGADAGLIPKGKPLGNTGQKQPSASERRQAERERRAVEQAEARAERMRAAAQAKQAKADLAKQRAEAKAKPVTTAQASLPEVPEPKRLGERVNRRLNPRISPVTPLPTPVKPDDKPVVAEARPVAAPSPVPVQMAAVVTPPPSPSPSPSPVTEPPSTARPMPASQLTPEPGFTSLPTRDVPPATQRPAPTLIGPVDPMAQPTTQPVPSPVRDTAPAVFATPAPVSDPVPTPVPTTTPAPQTVSLSDIISSIEVPEEEKQPTVAPVNLTEIAYLQSQRRKAEEEKAAKAAADQAKKDAAAKAKADAEAKKKADAEAAEKKEKARHPARFWVQIATGRDKKALAFDMRNFRKKYGDVLKGENAWTSTWGSTNRLVVGPFSTQAKAKAFDSAYRKAGGDGYVWESTQGLEVTPLAGGS